MKLIAAFLFGVTSAVSLAGVTAKTPATLTVTEQPDYIKLEITCAHRTRIVIKPGMCVVEGVDP